MPNSTEHYITYGAGRFVTEIPASMGFSGGYSMRNRNLKEVVWSEGDPQKPSKTSWEERLTEIQQMKPPEGKEKALIEVRDLNGLSKWSKAAFYYGDPNDIEIDGIPLKGYLDILRHTGSCDLWITSFGKVTGKDFMYNKSTDLARAYRPPTQPNGRAEVIPGKDAFYLRYGAIDLPFEYEESVDIVFKGHPLDEELLITVETKVVEEVYKVGLMERLGEMLASTAGMGFKAEKFRTRKRTVAGLKGEEVVYRGKEEDGEQALYFMWDFPGEKNSAHAPNMIITMMGRDGHLEEKLAIWDALLDSMRPARR
ncbi:MAG: hypothetical protein HY911_06935 [Desulfobacterales bacterium]|nr:hypothetical protein [Desulfobacterales bacterium]